MNSTLRFATTGGGTSAHELFHETLSARALELSPREVEVCAMLLVGRSYKEVARTLDISLASVKTYRERAFDTLAVTTREELLSKLLSERKLN